MELREHIDSLATGEGWGVGCRAGGGIVRLPSGLRRPVATACRPAELCRINEDQKVALDLDPYVKKLLNARRRVVLVNNILQNAQVRGWGSVVGFFFGGGGIAIALCSRLLFSHSRRGCGG